MTLDVRLLAIAGPPVLEESRFVAACRAAADGGVTAIQVRFKAAPAATTLRLTEALLKAVAVPVYVNDRADVALAAGAHGVHLGAEDVPPAAIRRWAPPPFRIGVSVGSPAEAAAIRDVAVDYWSVGAVFATATKPDAGLPIGIAGFRRLASLAPPHLSVIAIGGITATNADRVLAAGAGGVAVSSAIFGAPNVTAAARCLREVLDRREES